MQQQIGLGGLLQGGLKCIHQGVGQVSNKTHCIGQGHALSLWVSQLGQTQWDTADIMGAGPCHLSPRLWAHRLTGVPQAGLGQTQAFEMNRCQKKLARGGV